MAVPAWWQTLNQWTNKQSIQSLDRAHAAALAIENLEKQHFQGQKVSPNSPVGNSTYDYFKVKLDRELRIVSLNLLKFRLGNIWLANVNSNSQLNEIQQDILERLQQIEDIIGKYRAQETLSSVAIREERIKPNTKDKGINALIETNDATLLEETRASNLSFWGIRSELNLNEEQTLLQKVRAVRYQRKIATRFIAILVIVPLLTQIIFKNLVYSPLINRFFIDNKSIESIEINEEIAERHIEEFIQYKEIIEVFELLGIDEYNSDKIKQNKLQEKAKEVSRRAVLESQEGIKNVLADFTSFISFILLIIIFRRQAIISVKFLENTFLGLSNIAKVFFFILVTDMFVGFHSAEGWEILLGSFLGHIGLPENRAFIYLFIATVPVILDSTFKLLIFNYFTRKSPAAVAILEKMQQ